MSIEFEIGKAEGVARGLEHIKRPEAAQIIRVLVERFKELQNEQDALREKIGDWSQGIQNGSSRDTHDDICAMLDEADKAKRRCEYKYDPREQKPPHELATEGGYSAPEEKDYDY